MSLGELILLFGVAVQLYVGFIHASKVGKGKLLTEPMQRAIIRYAIRRKKLLLLIAAGDGNSIRALFQLPPLWGTWCGLLWVAGINLDSCYGLALIALYGDDLLSGYDLKKHWKTARNSIKWRRWTPTPILIPTKG